jgi:signal transduction histidine kinase
MARRHSLRWRIVLTIIFGVLATSLAFGLATFGIVYSIEDALFQRSLADEVAHQKSAWQRTGTLTDPKNAAIQVYRNDRLLPADIREEYLEDQQRTEFYGDEGRRYHVKRFKLYNGRTDTKPTAAVAIIEVNQQPFVRPYQASIIRQLILISLLIAIGIALFGWWLVNRAMKPLSDLAHNVTITQATIPTLHAKDYPANEIGVLAETLEAAFVRIRGFVERERTFTRDASHELRTPLTVVRGAAEVIALHRMFPSECAEQLRRIETATTDMALALDQLLALAREDDRIAKDDVALRPMIDKATCWAKLRYPKSSIAVSVTVGDSIRLFVNPTSLQLVLNNLIGNCFQHVGTGHLVVDYQDGCLLISDDGPGLPTNTDPFAPFAKGNASKGSGLGLDICRRLCDAAGIGLHAGLKTESEGMQFRLIFSGHRSFPPNHFG